VSSTDLRTELVIPSFNRLGVLSDTLKQVRALYPGLHICLGLQGEMPDEEFQQELDNDPGIRVEMMTAPGTTRTLNHCILSSGADVILIMDDDAIPCPGWLEAHLAAFTDDPDLLYTAGREVRVTKKRSAVSELLSIITEKTIGAVVGTDKRVLGRIVGWTDNIGLIFGNFDNEGTCLVNSPRGCNMAVRKELFLKTGGFREEFVGNAWGFEADFGMRAARQGNLGRFIGAAAVIHHEIASGGSREKGKMDWFRDFFANHRVLMREIGPAGWIGATPRLLKRCLFG
jgi:GT2 family glycosyltransferase